MTLLESLAGPAALIAAAATVIGAVTLILFFAKGGAWGLLNDIASIVLMLATIPVALAIRIVPASPLRDWGAAIAGVGIIGMLGATVSQLLLIGRRYTYQQLLPWTLGFGAVVGVWYLLIGFAGIGSSLFADAGPITLEVLAIASGVSFIALGYGFIRGNERHPLSVIGGVVLLVSSTWFLTWIGIQFISGEMYAG